jgi:hypothetical protein
VSNDDVSASQELWYSQYGKIPGIENPDASKSYKFILDSIKEDMKRLEGGDVCFESLFISTIKENRVISFGKKVKNCIHQVNKHDNCSILMVERLSSCVSDSLLSFFNNPNESKTCNTCNTDVKPLKRYLVTSPKLLVINF